MTSDFGQDPREANARTANWPASSYAQSPATANRQGYAPVPDRACPHGSGQPIRRKRPLWRIIVGCVLIAVGLLGVSGLAASANESLFNTAGDDMTFAYFLGQMIAILIFLVLPLALGIWMVVKPGKRVWPGADSTGQG